ncbi:inactive 2'-5'-oligoadenylate synthase 1B-like isoform X2 [Mastomys coucha]|uniref:inactive 2'-5'-oligoadenylate synthase 1B-like isoform X2 n=1 Tax=Mastomys coucha TaxID=35658 RepID=UPI001261D23B|nr:inactive 2'-5'-oligoadenylate synthase 1B-like isoform X2 [Mastomys coucha]
MEQRLRSIPASELDKFIENHLPDTSFCADLREVIDVLCALLKDKSFRSFPGPVRVSKAVKGGSSGKGTALKGRSHADLVVFLDNLTYFEDRLNKQGELIKEIKKQLYEIQHDRHFGVKFEVHSSRSPNSQALSFKLSAPDLLKEVKFDVLPTYHLLGHLNIPKRPNQQFYANLISGRISPGKDGEFSTWCMELRQYFLNWRPTKLKRLIRLVKHWYQLCEEKLGDPLPPQYALELLTIYAWECGGRITKFNTAQGFRTVLELITKYKQLQIYWIVCYDFLHPEVSDYLLLQLRKARPVILDPADPTWNVAGLNTKDWRRLAGEAAAWLQYPCFKYRDRSRVCSWDVPMEVGVPKQKNLFYRIFWILFWFLFQFIFGKTSSV